MTNEEAIKIIKQFRDRQGNSSDDVEAFEMAIEALKSQNSKLVASITIKGEDLQDIVNAIKQGKRLIDVESLKEQIKEYWETCDNDAREERCIACNKTMFESVLGMVDSEL